MSTTSTNLHLRTLAQDHRLRISRVKGDGSDYGDDRVQGSHGFLQSDGPHLVMVYTDDGRTRAHTVKMKNFAYKQVLPWVTDLRQDGDTEFIAHIQVTGLKAAIKVLGIHRLKVTAGVPVTDPDHLRRLAAMGTARRMSREAASGPPAALGSSR